MLLMPGDKFVFFSFTLDKSIKDLHLGFAEISFLVDLLLAFAILSQSEHSLGLLMLISVLK